MTDNEVWYQATKGRVKQCVIAGVDLIRYVHCARIYESLCKPYLTAELIVLDNNNLIEQMRLVGGEPVTIAIDAPPNPRTYPNATMYILSLQGRQSPENLKTQIYTFHLIGGTFFQDKKNVVQEGFKGIPGTAAIQKIWDKYLGADPLQILQHSTGAIGDKEGFQVAGLKPFAAIDAIRKQLTFPGLNTGSTLLFRDRDDAKFAPLERLFQTGNGGENAPASYIQKETWGTYFNDRDIYRAIIVAHLEIAKGMAEMNPGSGGGRSGINEIAAAMGQAQMVFDINQGGVSKNVGAQTFATNYGGGSAAALSGNANNRVSGFGDLTLSISSMVDSRASSILGAAAASMGGMPNVQITNKSLQATGTAMFNKTMGERMYSANARNGPQLTIKVPMQTGLEATVGRKIDVQLMPPTGDLETLSTVNNSMSGDWLVKDLMHEVYNDNREVNATTVIHSLRGGPSA